MAESNRERSARGGWITSVTAEQVFAIDGVRGGTYPRADALPAVTWNGVTVPFAQVDTARASTPANPQPAAGQVWAPPEGEPRPGWVDVDGSVTFAENHETPRDGRLCLTRGGTMDARDLDGWRCIGVATERGRVMVGDGFASSLAHQAFDVVGVVNGDTILTTYLGSERRGAIPLMDPANGWTRTRYATARVGERYLHRLHKAIVAIPDAPRMMAIGVMGDEVRVHLCAGVSMPVAEWERLDPSTASHAVAPVPQVAESDADLRARIGASMFPDTATGEHLDRLAGAYFGIERNGPKGSAYRGATEAESDESLRARCMAKLGVPSYGVTTLQTDAQLVEALGAGSPLLGPARLAMRETGVRLASKVEPARSHRFTTIHSAATSTAPLIGTRLASPGGIPATSPECRPGLYDIGNAARAFTRIHDASPKSTPVDPARARRGEVRRAVDRLIAADKGQPFATARAAALHAWAETLYSGDTVADVAAVHAGLLRYEALRGSRREPSLAAMDVGVPETARAMYERERAAVRVEAVTPLEESARPTGGASLNGWQTAAHFWERWSR